MAKTIKVDNSSVWQLYGLTNCAVCVDECLIDHCELFDDAVHYDAFALVFTDDNGQAINEFDFISSDDLNAFCDMHGIDYDDNRDVVYDIPCCFRNNITGEESKCLVNLNLVYVISA